MAPSVHRAGAGRQDTAASADVAGGHTNADAQLSVGTADRSIGQRAIRGTAMSHPQTESQALTVAACFIETMFGALAGSAIQATIRTKNEISEAARMMVSMTQTLLNTIG